MVNFITPNTRGGCIITTCHTPWARLLVQWCLQKEFAIIIASGIWIRRAKQVNKCGKGYTELRQIVNHLRSGGRIVITMDVFTDSKNCSLKFFEKECSVSLLPARLARIANVPIITVVPELSNQTILIHEGQRLDFNHSISTPGEIMQTLLTYFEKEIRKSPSIWSSFVQGSLSKQ